jgi:hypothetical protein
MREEERRQFNSQFFLLLDVLSWFELDVFVNYNILLIFWSMWQTKKWKRLPGVLFWKYLPDFFGKYNIWWKNRFQERTVSFREMNQPGKWTTKHGKEGVVVCTYEHAPVRRSRAAVLQIAAPGAAEQNRRLAFCMLSYERLCHGSMFLCDLLPFKLYMVQATRLHNILCYIVVLGWPRARTFANGPMSALKCTYSFLVG